MGKRYSILALLASLFMLALGPSDQANMQYLRYPGMLTNPGFENGKVAWTNSGSGALALVQSGSNLGYGKVSASWDAAASNDTLTSDQVTVPSGLYGQNCRVEMLMKGGDANLSLIVLDGTPTPLFSKVLSTQTQWGTVSLDFVCPTSGTFAVQIKASANAAIAYFDQIYMGIAGASSASGSGEVNVILNPDDSTNWGTSSATVSTASAAANIPLAGMKSTAISCSSSTNGGYCRYRWTMPEALKNKKLKAEWHQIASSLSFGDFKFEVYKNSASDYSGSYTKFDLSTDSSGTSSIPNLNGKYTTTFDADAGTYYELRLIRTAGTSAEIFLSNVIVGPGTQPQGAVVGPWFAYTPLFTGSTTDPTEGTNSKSGAYRRVGDTMDLRVEYIQTAAGSAGSGTYQISIPTGFTVDTTHIPTGSVGRGIVGKASLSLGTGSVLEGTVRFNNSNPSILIISIDNSTTGNSTWDSASIYNFGVTALRVSVVASFAVSQWTGSGTVNVAQNDAEYAYNTDTTNASNTSAFAIGPEGVQFTNVSASTKAKRVRFSSPVSATDLVRVEVIDAVPGSWIPLSDSRFVSTSATTGAALVPVNSTDYDVYFASAGYPANVISTTATAWSGVSGSNNFKWRVAKYKNGNAIGFGQASQNALGLVKAGQVPGTNTNDSATAGNVGEVLFSSASTVSLVTATPKTITSITLTAGDWNLTGSVSFNTATTTSVNVLAGGISTTNNALPAGASQGIPNGGGNNGHFRVGWQGPAYVPGSGNTSMHGIPTYPVTVANGATLTVYLVAQANFTVSTVTADGAIWARRIR